MEDERKCTMKHFLLHDNVRPHSAAQTQDLITSFKWEKMDHPPYSPDLAPSDFHLFLHLKKLLGDKRFDDDDDDDLKDAVQSMWKNSLKNVESDDNKTLYETLLDFFSAKRYLLSE